MWEDVSREFCLVLLGMDFGGDVGRMRGFCSVGILASGSGWLNWVSMGVVISGCWRAFWLGVVVGVYGDREGDWDDGFGLGFEMGIGLICGGEDGRGRCRMGYEGCAEGLLTR